MRILVVEDNELVADAVARGLSQAGFAVDHVADAAAADHAVGTERFDLAVLDLGLPGEGGLSLLRRWRTRDLRLPVIVLTARDALETRVEALDLGADDYLLKPFEQDELAARCRALIRRAHAGASGILQFGSVRVELGARQLSVGGSPVDLTAREWSVLECLALSAGRVVSKDRLQQAVAGFAEALTPNAVEVYVSRVRAKLGDAATIRAVRGLGYRLEEARP